MRKTLEIITVIGQRIEFTFNGELNPAKTLPRCTEVYFKDGDLMGSEVTNLTRPDEGAQVYFRDIYNAEYRLELRVISRWNKDNTSYRVIDATVSEKREWIPICRTEVK